MKRRILGAIAIATFTTAVVGGAVPGAADTPPGGAKMPTPLHSFVVAAHTDFLGRHPNVQELRYLHHITAARGKPAVLRSMASSDAWVSTIVTRFYRDTLGRDPDPAGLAHWRTQIIEGRISVAGVAARFYASEEYVDGIGGGTVASWVTDLYEKLLGRAPDPDGLAWWADRTATQGRTRVAAELYQSMESRRQRVTALYESLLGRTPDDAGRDHWAARILRDGDLALAVDLAASGEYAARALARFPAYSYQEMPLPAGDDHSWASLINDAGTIAGPTWSWGPNDQLISARTFTARTDGTQLRILPPAVDSEPHIDIRGMNDTGQLVGCGYAVSAVDHAPGPCRAYYYDAGLGATDAHAFWRGRQRSSEAIDITDDRVMLVSLSDGTSLLFDTHAIKTTFIPDPPGGPEGCVATAMSDGPGRYVVGNCERDDVSNQAWIYDRTTGQTNTIPVPAGHHTVLASDVNSSGTVAVTLIRTGGLLGVYAPFTYRSTTGQYTRIPLPGETLAYADAINDHGTVVGLAATDDVATFTWDPDTRQSTYLDGLDFIPSRGPEMINDAGQIVGSDLAGNPVVLA